MAKNTSSKRRAPPRPDPVAFRDEIEKRAYARYCARGGVDGFADEDWLEAEREVLSQHTIDTSTRGHRTRLR